MAKACFDTVEDFSNAGKSDYDASLPWLRLRDETCFRLSTPKQGCHFCVAIWKILSVIYMRTLAGKLWRVWKDISLEGERLCSFDRLFCLPDL